MVGLNGTGKSTLLRLLTKAEEPDSGRVTHRRDLRVLSLPQTLDLAPTATVRDVVVGPRLAAGRVRRRARVGRRRRRPYRPDLDSACPASAWTRRSARCPAASGDGSRWPRCWSVRATCSCSTSRPTTSTSPASTGSPPTCASRRGALVVVTHDRWFLDAVCDRTWEVADETVRPYEGGYAAWVLARAERARVAADGRGAAAEPAAQGDRVAAPRAAGPYLQAEVPHRRGQRAHRRRARAARHGLAAAAGDGPAGQAGLRRWPMRRYGSAAATLLSNVDWLVGPGDRIGIVGGNGAGKSTLLRVLAGTQPLDGGELTGRLDRTDGVPVPGAGRAARLGCGCSRRSRRSPAGSTSAAASCPPRQLAEIFGFTERRLWTPVADLSGGERRRLQMLRLLAGEPNVLLLDEPTNDLDTDTLASLEDLLDTWPGTMVIASHDRYLVERVCDTVYALYGDGRLTHLPGRRSRSTWRAVGTMPRHGRRPTPTGPTGAGG